MRKFKKAGALIISVAMMIAAAGCGKDGKIEKRERTTRESVIVTVDRDRDKTTTEVVTTETSTDTTTTTEVTTEKPVVDPDAEKAFKQFEDDFLKYALSDGILNYHYTVNDGSKFGIERPAATWGEVTWSDEDIEKDKKELEDWMNKLKAIDRNSLSETDQISYDIYMEDFEDSMNGFNYIFYTGDLSPMGGFQSDFANYFTDWSFYNKQDVEDYITLLETTPDHVDKLIQFEKDRAAKGYIMSDANIDDVIEQCNTFVEGADNHFLIEVFDTHIDELDFLTDEEKADYKAKNKDAIINKVIPSFNNISAALGELKGKGTNQNGLSHYDGGADCYAYIMKKRTGSSKSPQEALEVLYARYDEIMPEMAAIYQADPDAYNYYVENYDSLLSEADTTMTPKEVIDKLMVVDTAEYPAIDTIPYSVDYLDKPLETIMENTLAYYRSPNLDDPNNNIIKVNGGHLNDLWATLAHEGFPGHMYQNAYFMSTKPSNLRAIEGFVGYMEGWAKYVEYDSYKAWDFPDTESDENVARFCALDSEMNMLIMGIFDIEVNYNGWTATEASKWLEDHGLNSGAAQGIIDTVAGDPAIYQSYVLGYYEMKGLRTKAENALGAKFDPVEFNRVVLTTGPCQFDVLEKQVDKYIDENK